MTDHLAGVIAVDPLRRQVLQFACLPCVLCLRTCSASLNELLLSDNMLMQELMNVLLSPSGRSTEAKLSLWDFVCLGSRLTSWPSKMELMCGPDIVQHCLRCCRDEETRLEYEVCCIRAPSAFQNGIYGYCGVLDGSSRSLVSDDHWPSIGGGHGESPACRPATSLPFTNVYVDPNDRKSKLISSCFAYFEVTIHDSQSAAKLRHPPSGTPLGPSSRDAGSPCVCIGISAPGFNFSSMMPGWDQRSLGWHGDDGHFYLLEDCIEMGPTTAFGEGDTVGFGIFHACNSSELDRGAMNIVVEENAQATSAVVLTKNGQLLRVLPMGQNALPFSRHAWFPTVGIDCHWPVEVNFGNSGQPFAFDVVGFESGRGWTDRQVHFGNESRIESIDLFTRSRMMMLGFVCRAKHFCRLIQARYSQLPTKPAKPTSLEQPEYQKGHQFTLLPRHVFHRFLGKKRLRAPAPTSVGDATVPLFGDVLLSYFEMLQSYHLRSPIDPDQRFAEFEPQIQMDPEIHANIVKDYKRVYGQDCPLKTLGEGGDMFIGGEDDVHDWDDEEDSWVDEEDHDIDEGEDIGEEAEDEASEDSLSDEAAQEVSGDRAAERQADLQEKNEAE